MALSCGLAPSAVITLQPLHLLPPYYQLNPSGFLMSFGQSGLSQLSNVFFLTLSHPTVGAITHGVASAPTYLALTMCAASFSALEVADPSTLSKS
jgi:hypothetical protein